MASLFTILSVHSSGASKEVSEGFRAQLQSLGAELADRFQSSMEAWKPSLTDSVAFIGEMQEDLSAKVGESLPLNTPEIAVRLLPLAVSLLALVLPTVLILYVFAKALSGFLFPKKNRKRKRPRRAFPNYPTSRTIGAPVSADQRLARHAAVAAQSSVEVGSPPPLLSAEDAGHLTNAGLEYSVNGWSGVHNSQLGPIEFQIKWDKSEKQYGIYSQNHLIRLGADGECWNKVNGKIHVHGECHDLLQTYLQFMTWLALKEKELNGVKPKRRAS